MCKPFYLSSFETFLSADGMAGGNTEVGLGCLLGPFPLESCCEPSEDVSDQSRLEVLYCLCIGNAPGKLKCFSVGKLVSGVVLSCIS